MTRNILVLFISQYVDLYSFYTCCCFYVYLCIKMFFFDLIFLLLGDPVVVTKDFGNRKQTLKNWLVCYHIKRKQIKKSDLPFVFSFSCLYVCTHLFISEFPTRHGRKMNNVKTLKSKKQNKTKTLLMYTAVDTRAWEQVSFSSPLIRVLQTCRVTLDMCW